VFSRRARNELDAAIALSSTANLGTATPAGGYGTPSSETATAFVGMAVQKYGRTTGMTSGEITAINATVNVGYSRGTARFVKQIIVESGTPFIGGGDSGSLLVTDDSGLNPVGLLFAGTGDGLLAVANPIDLVLDRFGVTVDSDETPTTTPSAPVADFIADQTSGDAPLTVYFYDLSEEAVTSWAWDFGDLGTSDEQDLSHTYESAGDYTVSLTVTGPGGSDTLTKTNYIIVSTTPSPPELVSIAVKPETASIQVGSTQQYSATGTYTDASTADITNGAAWTSSNNSVATINEAGGLATAISVGSATITATLYGKNDTATLSVTEAPSEVQVFSDSFESSADWTANWSQDSQNDWRRRTSRKKEGNYAAEVDGRATDAQLISIPIDLQGKTNATVTFWWYIESGLDTGEYLAFDVSTDGGDNWPEMASLNGNVDVDPENTWHNESINVTGISSLRIRFRGTMSSSIEDAYVDVVKVVAW
jgi:PKD repeat protein